jgi:hypothetical protein
MPVSQSDTATTVASTGTYDVARFGIEGRSVRDAAAFVNPLEARCGLEVRCGAPIRACLEPASSLSVSRDGELRLISSVGRTTVPDSMPSAFANAEPVRTPIISFAIFAAYKRS